MPVAELALGLALDLARGITAADGAMRAGTELYGSKGRAHARLLSGTRAGIIGFGAIGRAIRTLLRGFDCEVVVHDPWLPAGTIREAGAEPATLADLLATADTIFVSAAVTSENAHLLGRAELERIKSDASLVLVSRAGVVDFDALVALADAGRFRAATDVFPAEPVPAGDPVRTSRLLLSPHRGGGMRAALSTAAEMISTTSASSSAAAACAKRRGARPSSRCAATRQATDDRHSPSPTTPSCWSTCTNPSARR